MASRKPDERPHLRARSHGFSRRVAVRELRQRFLIVCEGSETEKNYFEAFKVPRDVASIDVHGLGDNTLSLVQRTLEKKAELESQNRVAFDQVWCVFDRDSFPPQNFNEAIRLAESENVRVAYSNEAFEIWYLLHFDFHTAALSRHQYSEMLSHRLGRKYFKNDPEIYNLLYNRQKNAIKNARKLISQYPSSNPVRDNPSTTVHLLVEALNKYSVDAQHEEVAD